MQTVCFSLLLLLSAVNLTEFNVPKYSETMYTAHVHNLTCHRIEVANTTTSITSAGWIVRTDPTLNVSCRTNFDVMTYSGDLVFDLTFDAPTEIELSTTTLSDCTTSESVLRKCSTHVIVNDMHLEPPSTFLDFIIARIRSSVSGIIENDLCKKAIPRLQAKLANHTVEPPHPPPPLVPGAERLLDTPLFRAILHIVSALPAMHDIEVETNVVGDPTMRLAFDFPRGKTVHVEGDINDPDTVPSVLPEEPISTWIAIARSFLKNHSFNLHQSLVIPELAGSVSGLVADTWLPIDTRSSIEVSFHGLHCLNDTYNCSVDATGGITVDNVRIATMGDVGRLFTNFVNPDLAEQLNTWLTTFTQNRSVTDDQNRSRFIIPMKARAVAHPVPPRWVLIALGVGCLAVGAFVLGCGVVRQMRSPVRCTRTGEPLSLRRVVVEDAILCVAVCGCAVAFAWSNVTTAASVVIGSELEIYAFSLMNTAEDLWSAGLKPLSVCVFLFSGVYPYFKLISMVVFSVVLQRPDAAVLHLIDYIGKFSFLDTFVLLIMVNGLEVAGIADIYIGPSFYIFLAATVGSIATGNYVTQIWRRHTTLRQHRCPSRRSTTTETSDATAPLLSTTDVIHAPAVEAREDGDAESTVAALLFVTSKARLMHSATVMVVVLCSVPVWIRPCLSYTLGGVAPLITDSYKSFDLFQLSSATSWVCFAVTCFTVLVAPCLYVVCIPTASWLSSWCAGDAFVVACVAGLLQLNQFVQFILGPGMEDVYVAHAGLLWPLLPLAVGSVVVWWCVLRDTSVLHEIEKNDAD